ncbi:MAG: VOC family protein [Acidimicrobiales bacterium]
MAISRLNHAVLYVRDAEATAAFYSELLGFEVANAFPGGVFMRVAPDSPNDHDIAFFSIGAGAGPSTAGRASVGLYHLAWEVPTLRELLELRARLLEAGSLAGESDHGVSKSLYCKDPDGIEFELMWAVPVDRLTEADAVTTKAIDWDAAVQRFGLDTVSVTEIAAP